VDQIGKLNVHRNAGPDELLGLHPADRLMVKLIEIDRLAPRVDGMLYKTRFDESWSLLNEVSRFILCYRERAYMSCSVNRAHISSTTHHTRFYTPNTSKSYLASVAFSSEI
jgi:hypothetical protein